MSNYSEADFCDPEDGLDYIFGYMGAIYGAAFNRHWEGMDLNLVRHVWKEQLGRFLTYKPSMDYTLSHLDGNFPPSAIKFREICNKGPAIPRKPEETLTYQAPKMTEEAKRKGLEKLNALRRELAGGGF